MRLVLLRHAKAEPFGAMRDFDRRLVEAGRERALAAARALSALGVAPDLALVSPSARTRETWETIRPVLGGEMQTVDALYHAAPETILAAVKAVAAPELTLAVVGHNPGMGELARTLAHESGAPLAALQALDRGYPTASAAVFDNFAEDEPCFHALVVRGEVFGA